MDNVTLAGANAPAPITQETAIVDVETAKAEWEIYQKLVRELLDDSDYQEYNQGGKLKKFPKKSAWTKLGRAFNVDTEIVDKEFVLTKTGETREAYYCIRATLPNGRTVESDGSCSRHEKGKGNATSHTIRSTAKTRATNRAISELIGAGEVSAEELDPSFDNGTPIKKPEPKKVDLTEPEFIDVDVEVVKDPEPFVKPVVTIDNAEEISRSIINELPERTIPEAYKELARLNKLGVLSDQECEAVKKEIDKVLK